MGEVEKNGGSVEKSRGAGREKMIGVEKTAKMVEKKTTIVYPGS